MFVTITVAGTARINVKELYREVVDGRKFCLFLLTGLFVVYDVGAYGHTYATNNTTCVTGIVNYAFAILFSLAFIIPSAKYFTIYCILLLDINLSSFIRSISIFYLSIPSWIF